LAEVLPRLVDLLPVKEDYQENAPAFRCIIALCKFPTILTWFGQALINPVIVQAQNPEMLKLASNIAPAITKALGPPTDQLDDETRAHLTELVAYMSGK
jgi:hypothetical protein